MKKLISAYIATVVCFIMSVIACADMVGPSFIPSVGAGGLSKGFIGAIIAAVVALISYLISIL